VTRLTLIFLMAALGAVAEAAEPEPTLDEVTAAGREWRFETARGAIRVWIPASYDPATAVTVVFVHGYHLDTDEVWRRCRLPSQFALSGLNAMFVAAEAPERRRDTIAWPSPTGLLAAVAAHTDVAMPTQRLVAIGHSGAYRTLSAWLADARLDTLILLDAAYGDHGFTPWLHRDVRHRLINIAAGDTELASADMHRQLPDTRYAGDLSALPAGRVVYARAGVGHWNLVTDGVALPLALRAIDGPLVARAPLHLPLGLPDRSKPR
jgi:hypothetical protein